MKNIIFIAPPAAGKGTISQMIEKECGIPQISTGDLFRAITKETTPFAKKVKDLIDNGKLVDDETTTELIKNRIIQDDCKNGYILDGYPRTIPQAEAYDKLLDELGYDLGFVIKLNVPKEDLKERLTSRVSCSKCKKIYNLSLPRLQPKQKGICDDCGGELVQREDDTEEAFEIRYNTYLEKTAPLVKYYEEKGVLRNVEQSESIKAFEEVKEIING